jgi:hypothetical protein
MVLGELYLSFSLRGDEVNIGDHQKKGRSIGELLEQKKHSYLQYDSFMGIYGGIGELLEMLSVEGR